MKRGFTLVEVIVVLVLFFAVAGMAVQLLASPYRETARSVRRTADQVRIVEVMEYLVADSLFFQAHANTQNGTPAPLLALTSNINAQCYGDDITITTTPRLSPVHVAPKAGLQNAEQNFGQAPTDLLLITVEKNGMRLSRVFSN